MKALALGAKCVFVGRPFIYAAAVGGAAGVLHAIRILAEEIRRDLGLSGLNSPQDLTAEQMVQMAHGRASRQGRSARRDARCSLR